MIPSTEDCIAQPGSLPRALILTLLALVLGVGTDLSLLSIPYPQIQPADVPGLHWHLAMSVVTTALGVAAWMLAHGDGIEVV